jgi:hypothetical protein
MYNENQATSGANTEISDSVADKQESVSTSGENTQKTAYDKLLREKKNASLALQDAKAKLAEYDAFKAQVEEEKLLKEKQYETLLDNYKKKLGETESKLTGLEKTIENSKKNTAILNELKKLGFVDSESNRKAVSRLVDTSMASIDPQTNVVIGADEAAKAFYQEFNSLGFFGKQTSGANHNAPKINLNSGNVDLSSMSKDEKVALLKSIARK